MNRVLGQGDMISAFLCLKYRFRHKWTILEQNIRWFSNSKTNKVCCPFFQIGWPYYDNTSICNQYLVRNFDFWSEILYIFILRPSRTVFQGQKRFRNAREKLFDQLPLTLLGTALALAGGKVVRTEGRHTKGYKNYKAHK